jgi:hypothetical protein
MPAEGLCPQLRKQIRRKDSQSVFGFLIQRTQLAAGIPALSKTGRPGKAESFCS